MSTAAAFTQRTAWTRNLAAPLRAFLRAESASAALLVAASVAALVWRNAGGGSYESLWTTHLAVSLDGHAVDLELRTWVNSGLMSFFFFVVGLEARREFDVGELRERRRLALPLIGGLAGLALPVAIYLAFNAGRSTAHGWGTAMSTDTAFALGVLAVLARRLPDQLRPFMVTVLVVDDLVSIVVIVLAYSSDVAPTALLVALALFAVVLAVRWVGIRRGPVYLVLGIAIWVALVESGIEPIVVGLALGLLAYAYPAARVDLERASDLFRLFREQPTSALARTASSGLESALSPNERLQAIWLPWSSFVIVPLFALANAGVAVGGASLGRAIHSPVTLGIFVGYVVGKPVAITLVPWLVSRLTRGRILPSVGWLSVAAAGTSAGTPFTVSLLIGALAFTGPDLEAAKLGVLAAALVASALAVGAARAASLLPPGLRVRALLGRSESIVDLAVPVDPQRDYIRGSANAEVTLVEYGDFECPFCGQAEVAIRELLGSRADVAYVWRHLPLNDVHPHAQLAAEAAEAAAAEGKFWEMHDLLLTHQQALAPRDLVRYAGELGLDVDRFTERLRRREGSARIADDVDSADRSGVAGTPTFFVNGRRHWGAYDVDGLKRAAREAAARARIAPPAPTDDFSVAAWSNSQSDSRR